jgi:hypothetical protein
VSFKPVTNALLPWKDSQQQCIVLPCLESKKKKGVTQIAGLRHTVIDILIFYIKMRVF